MAWQAPAKDGNSPITGYVVETADADANEITFTAAGDTNSNTLRLKVSHLVTGKHYRVRVFAKYAIGQSEPVCLDEPVLLPSGESIIHLLSCYVQLLFIFQFC